MHLSLIKRLFFIASLVSTCLLNAYSIVYVHIGPTIPDYLAITMAQARLFNEQCPIYLIANKEAIKKISSEFSKSNIIYIACEALKISKKHKKFHKNKNHDWSLNGFWVYTSERFFYLEEFVSQYKLNDVFHFENDIMLYADLNSLLPIFHKHYKGMIGATFENDDRCVPSIMYIPNSAPLTALVNSFPLKVDMLNSDMENVARFKDKNHKSLIDYLPIVVREYAYDHPLQAFAKKSLNPEFFSNYLSAIFQRFPLFQYTSQPFLKHFHCW